MDAVVIGGGIVGLSAAYYLGEAGANVTLYEKNSLGTGSTSRAAGGIRSQFSTEVNVKLSMASREVWERFEDSFGVDLAYRKPGYLFLAQTAEMADQFQQNVQMQNELGVDTELLTPEQASEQCPGLLTDQFTAATYNSTDGFADPNLAVQGYASAARETGVDIQTNTAVTDVLTNGNTVIGVETADGVLSADFVVNTAGAWAARIGEMASVELPIRPRRRQIAVVEPSKPVAEDVPLTINLETGSYFRPERDGAALVGGYFDAEDPDADADTYSESMDMAWAATAVEHAAEYTTYFGPNSRIRRGWAGLYAVTPDHHPIIEETVPGFITAAGFSGHGFQHAPATGQIVRDLCLSDSSTLVDVTPLSGRRFGDNDGGRVEQNVA
ncbi:NAD(P)/FAD-dependent oxidoreductase [Halomicrococcus sp. NG-SE-24]|uniref:NAD(P)/FAD-dependent oxidoreductase n=1 Tax=Halomicrococcus sp. NG-SE-24 TaxID=3436928 RepID=UPI003D9978B4